MKKITAFLVCVMLVIASVAIQTDSVYAATQMVSFVIPDGGGAFQVEAEEVAADATEWGSGGSEGTKTWLYIAEDIDNSGKDIIVHGDVHLILGDNTTFKCRTLSLDGENSNISFYSQSYGEGMGTFIADNTGGKPDAAAIGTDRDINGGNITIYGGNIQAKNRGGSYATIGCGYASSMGTITINGGNVTAIADKYGDFTGPAIGTAWRGDLESIIINGGNINASAVGSKAAIGGACTSLSSFGAGTIELNGGNITAYADGTVSDLKAIGGYEDEWTVTSVQNGKTIPINSCYWYMVGGNNPDEANNIAELGDNHFVKLSRKKEIKHSYVKRFPIVQPKFDAGGTLTAAGRKAYFQCACGDYHEDNSEAKYIGSTEEELDAWKQGAGKLEEKYLADYLCYENGKMNAKSQESFYNMTYDGAVCYGVQNKITWYYIDEDIEFNHNIELMGDVRIVLADGVTARFNNGLNMYKDYGSLTIYAQSEGDAMGALTAGSSSVKGAPCIGGNAMWESKVRIDGGNITAVDKDAKVGIGGGNYVLLKSSITINGGRITAAGYGGAAIGFDGTGYKRDPIGKCIITINGGTIDAVSHGGNAAAIGADGNYELTTIINGGNITALGDGSGPAIGLGPVGYHTTSSTTIRHCLFDTAAGEGAETSEKCDYNNQRYVKMVQAEKPVHRLKNEYPMWAPRFNSDDSLASAGCRGYYQCLCGYYFSDRELTNRITDLTKWKENTSINGGKLDHEIHPSNEPTCSEGGYKEYYSKGKLYFSNEACTESIENLRAWKIKGGAGYLAPLKHDFTYTADGNVLTGTCSRECCDLAYNKATLTIIGGEYFYDGKGKTPEIVNNGWDASIPEIDYTGKGKTDYSGKTAPKDVGTYVASITVDGATASTEFVISDNPAVKELEELLKEATSKLESANKEIENLNSIVNDRNKTIEEKTQVLENKSAELNKMTEALAQTKAELEQKSKDLEVANCDLDSIKESIAELQNLYNRVIKDLENANGGIQSLNLIVNDQNKTIKEKTQALNEITETLAQTKTELENAVKRAEEAEKTTERLAEKNANDAYIKGTCENVTLKFNGRKLSSGKTAFYFGEKGTAKLQKFEDMGYVLEFKYYKAESKTKPTAPKCNIYMSTSRGRKTADNGYQMVPTKGTKDMYYAYAAEINVYDAEDNLVATIAKDQVNFGWAKWTGKTIK